MNQYAAAVLLRHTDNRQHSVAVIVTCGSPEQAIELCEKKAFSTVAPEAGWSVESSWLFDQHIIDAEFHPAPEPAEDWPNAHGRRLNENLEAY